MSGCTGDIGKLISQWRRSAGLSQSNLADAIGTQQATISKLESGNYRLSFDMLMAILNACGLSLHEVACDIESAIDSSNKPLWERIDE